MAETAFDRLNAAVDALISALDIDDINALEGAMASVPQALDAMRIPSAWTPTPENKVLLETLGEKLDGARLRVAILGDLGRRRLDQLALVGVSAGSGATYSR